MARIKTLFPTLILCEDVLDTLKSLQPNALDRICSFVKERGGLGHNMFPCRATWEDTTAMSALAPRLMSRGIAKHVSVHPRPLSDWKETIKQTPAWKFVHGDGAAGGRVIYLYDVKGLYDKQVLSGTPCYSCLPLLDGPHFDAVMTALFEGDVKLFRDQDLLLIMDGRKPSNLAAITKILNLSLKKKPRCMVKNLIMRLHYHNQEFAKGALQLTSSCCMTYYASVREHMHTTMFCQVAMPMRGQPGHSPSAVSYQILPRLCS